MSDMPPRPHPRPPSEPTYAFERRARKSWPPTKTRTRPVSANHHPWRTLRRPLCGSGGFWSRLNGLQARLRRRHDGFGGDGEFAVEAFEGGGGAEGFHADEAAVLADEALPALAHAGLDGDADGGLADDLGLVAGRLALEQLPAGRGDDAGGDSAGLQQISGGHGHGDLTSGGEQADLGGAVGAGQLVGALGGEVAAAGAHGGRLLSGQGHDRGGAFLFQRRLPALGGLPPVGGAG